MKYILPILFTLFALSSSGQTDLHNFGEEITIANGTKVYISGDLNQYPNIRTLDVDSSSIFNRGEIFLKGDINGLTGKQFFRSDSMGLVVFEGNSLQHINGNHIRFFQAELNNPGGLILHNNIVLHDSLKLIDGNLNLNGEVLYLADSIGEGVVSGESNSSRIYGSNGYIETTRTIGDVLNENVAGLGLTIENLNTLGNTTLRRYHFPQTNAGDGSIEKFYTLDAFVGDEVEFRIDYLDVELNGLTETELDMWYSEDSTIWRRQISLNSASGNYVQDTIIVVSTPHVLTLAERYCDSPPVVDLGNSTQYLCAGQSVILDTELPGMEYRWNTLETTQSITVTTQGTYDVIVTDNNGCVGYDTVTIIEKPMPSPAFTAPFTCFNQSSVFTNTSSGADYYHWDFGDLLLLNDTSNLASPNFLYADTGLYEVTLITSTTFGCVDSIKNNMLIHPLPEVSFSMADNCEDSLISFTDGTTIDSPVGGMSYGLALFDWNFGDGQSSSTQNPGHVYTSSGTYNVELEVTSNAGCTNTITQPIIIHPNPVASFTNSQACENTDMIFTNTSSGASNYLWEFGDFTTSTNTSPNHFYGNNGNYSVDLTATSGFGCSHSVTQIVFVDSIPNASFSFSDDCENNSILFTNTSNNFSGSAGYEWSFGDGNTSNVASPTNTYSSAGNYVIELVVTAPNTCSDTSNSSITVFPKPIVSFSATDDCENEIISFVNNSTIGSGTMTYDWDFGDNNTSTLTSPIHSYPTNGNYTVKLIATSNEGCIDSTSSSITIFPNPIVNLGGTVSTCGPSLVLDAQNAGSSFLWSDNSTNSTLTATVDGEYWVQVTSPQSCITNDTVDVFLNITSIPNLGNDTTVCDSLILDAFAPSSTYTWSTGSTASSITALTSGQYWIDRVDQNSCPGSDTINVTINYSPVVELGADTTLCAYAPLALDAQNASNNILWNTGEVTSTISVDTSGVFEVIVTTLDGCVTSDSIDVTFNPVPAVWLGNDTSVCDQIMISPGSYNSYLWSTGGTASTETITTSGTHWLEVANVFNCVSRDSIDITVFDSPVLELGNDTAICYGQSIDLDAGSAASYLWSTGATTQNITANSSDWYSVTSTTGICSSTDSIEIIVDTLWDVDLGPDQYVCPNYGITLDAGITGWDYQWESLNNGVLGLDQTQLITESDMVWVTVTNPFGCTQIDTILVNDAPYPIVSEFLVATEIFPGDTVHFVPVSTDSITTYQWDFGDGVTSTDQFPWHVFYITDTFHVELIASNSYCSDTAVKPVIVSLLKDDLHFDFPLEEDTLSDINYVWMYPNPNSGNFTLVAQLKKEKDLSISFYNLSGKLIHRERNRAEFFKKEYEMYSLESGVYLIEIRVGLERKILKWVKL